MLIIFRKSTFENFYRQNPRYKNEKIDIGHFEMTKVTSNPKYWSPFDVYKYLSSDLYCIDIGLKLLDEVSYVKIYLSWLLIIVVYELHRNLMVFRLCF